MIDNKYNSKYLKYKNKYLNLKKIIGGGIGTSKEASTTEASIIIKEPTLIPINCVKDDELKSINLNIDTSLVQQLKKEYKSGHLIVTFGNETINNNDTLQSKHIMADATLIIESAEIKTKEHVDKLIVDILKMNSEKMEESHIKVVYDDDNNLLDFTIDIPTQKEEWGGPIIKVNIDLPETFTNLTVINDLTLQCLGLKILGEDFGYITVGRNLKLDGNQLDTLPESFGNIKVGGELSLSRNQLNNLPESFGNIKVGGSLNLSKNKLKILPSSFSSIKFNGHLNLSYNLLENLPDNFGHSEYELNNIPKSMVVNGNLNLSHNNLKELPESFKDIIIINNLNLTYNNFDINNVPEWLKKITQSGKTYIINSSAPEFQDY